MGEIETIEAQIADARQALLNHEVYHEVRQLENLQVLMEHHVFAVWDFMSLLKALQERLSCTQVPWLPSSNVIGSRLVNEIVLGEESDEDGEGGFASHFELYLRAMRSCGADTGAIEKFLTELAAGHSTSDALQLAGAPRAAQAFVLKTMALIERDNVCEMASAFTFGREDLLPDLFTRIVDELNDEHDGQLAPLQYYLHRHIELDGDEHGAMAIQLLKSLCGDNEDRWETARRSALESLQARQSLWDGVVAACSRTVENERHTATAS